MPSASPPDPSGEGEVVEVFAGDSLEDAMAAAVAALGPGLTVRRARKVRAGVRGLLGRDRYEVLAVPPPDGSSAVPPSDDAVGSALDALLEAADEQEAGGPAARPVSRPSADRPLSARPSSLRLPDPPPLPAAGGPAPLPPAPRSGGPTGRRGRPAVGDAGTDVLPAAPAGADVVDAEVVDPPVVPLGGAPTDVTPGRHRGDDHADAPARARRTLGLPLSGRSPHPAPQVGDHDQAPPSRRRRRPNAPVSAPPGEPDGASAGPGDVAGGPAPHEGGGVALRPVPSSAGPAPAPPSTAAPAGPVDATAAARTSPEAPVGWSRAALSRLGVPAVVLDALPSPAPRDDLGWVVALTAAIGAAVPPPAEPDGQHPVVVSGYGLQGALAVLDAGSRGLAPGTITHAGRTAPATATELALVLRHHVTTPGA